MRHWLARWGKWLVFATAVVGALGADIVYRSLAYREGYGAFESLLTLLSPLWFLLAVGACSLVAIASATYLLVSAVTKAPRCLVDFVPFLIVIVLFVTLWTNTRNRQYYFLTGMRDWVSEHPSMVQEIDEWFRTLENDKSLSKTRGYLIDAALSPGEQVIKAEWPPCVRRLHPTCVALAYVHGAWQGDVQCGGGFLCWGLVICDSQEAVSRHVYGYVMKVGPTSYVYVEAPEQRLFVD